MLREPQKREYPDQVTGRGTHWGTHEVPVLLSPVGRTGFGNVDEPAAVGAQLRHVADLDGDASTPTPAASPEYATALATCALESTDGNDVVNALARAALEWLVSPDVKRLRFALLGIIASLD